MQYIGLKLKVKKFLGDSVKNESAKTKKNYGYWKSLSKQCLSHNSCH